MRIDDGVSETDKQLYTEYLFTASWNASQLLITSQVIKDSYKVEWPKEGKICLYGLK